MTDPAFTITIYDQTLTQDVLDEAYSLYRAVYAEPPYLEQDDDFAAFAKDLPRRVTATCFRLVLARSGRQPVGFGLGHGLLENTAWWDGALELDSEAVAAEHNERTFVIIELAVLKTHRRKRIATALHAHLLAGQHHERATLLVRPDATPAKESYSSWGYRKVGLIKPFPEAPVYESMVLTFPSDCHN